jgi:hypothetical protein
MYKLSTTQLEALKEALVKSNNILKCLAQEDDSAIILNAIASNDAQIKVLTEQFYVA